MQWKYGSGFSEVLVADDGEILATVSNSIGTGCFMECGGISKRYYTLEQAKAAAEKLVKGSEE